jgi:hypothetical protein
MSATVPEEHREVLDAPFAVLTTLGPDAYPQSTMVSYRFARPSGRKYGGTEFSYADRPSETRVGVVLRPVRVNLTDLRTPAGG